jgi:endonuclease YncB( thermonuclease family)
VDHGKARHAAERQQDHKMIALRKAAAFAAVVVTVLTAGHSAALAFDTTPQYQPYQSTSQTVPKISLPPSRASQQVSVEQSGSLPEPVPQTTAPAQPTASQAPLRRTDAAGAVRKNQDNGKSGAVKNAAPSTAAGATTEQKYPEGTVIEGKASVYDGQNLLVSNVPIRLDSAEAPAISQQCMTRQSLVWNCGIRAAGRLKELADGRKVRCVVTEPLGSGAAAICSVIGVSDLGAAMIREGMAVSNGHDHGRYSAQQASARLSKSGIWIGPFEAPWIYKVKNGP